MVGLQTDANILNEILTSLTNNVEIHYFNDSNFNHKLNGDIAIWIQNFLPDMLPKFKKNVFFINEEWAGEVELSNLSEFDVVICKSKYAKKQLEKYSDNIEHFYFVSNDMYLESTTKIYKQFLHFPGRSIQKNTESVLECVDPLKLTLIDPYNRYITDSNHIKTYLPIKDLIYQLNMHETHICPSLYESWGHYLFESLSTKHEIICSRIPVFEEVLDPSMVHFLDVMEMSDEKFEYCKYKDKFPLRKHFFINTIDFKDKITNFIPNNKREERRKFFLDLMLTNRKKLTTFFKNI